MRSRSRWPARAADHGAGQWGRCLLTLVVILMGASTTVPAGSLQWQLVDDGTPLRGPYVDLFHFDETGETWLRQGGGDMLPLWWVRNGERWERRLFSPGPPPNTEMSLAYDSNRKRLVHFGGITRADDRSAETWEFDGTNWVHRTDVGGPTPRDGAEMAFDSTRKVMVMFGGFGPGNVLLNDTWEYDGVVWRPVSVPTPRPGVRYGHSMAYDAQRQRTVLAFGSHYTGFYNDTWEYDGVRWIKGPSQPTLASRAGTGIAYDTIRRKVYIFGGTGGGGETRYWTGTQWQLITTAVTPPTPRLSPAMTFDKVLGESVVYGGNDSTGVGFGDTWKFNGTRWQQFTQPIASPHRAYSSVAYDATLHAAIAYGGNDSGPPVDGTWLYVNGAWVQSPAPSDPGLIEEHVSTYDPILHRTVVAFGYDRVLNLCTARAWLYDSAAESWQPVLGVKPQERCGAAASFSAKHAGTLSFAGLSQAGQGQNDTWLLTASGWQQLQATNPPPRRYNHALTYDSRREEVVVYGGSGDPSYLSDTWVLRGTQWVQIGASGPGPRFGSFMAYDPIRGVSVLGGGNVVVPLPEDELTWLFDGTSWSSVSTTYSPDMGRLTARAAWDPDHEAVLLAAGSAPPGYHHNDLWAFGWDADDDLKVGRFDNCINIPNANQANLDGDAAGDLCDCAPTDGTVFAIPVEVAGVTLPPDKSTLNWTSAQPTSGSSTVHDVLRGALAQLPVGSGTGESCVVSGTSAATASDSALPAAGDGFWYLVRARNLCGVGSYGVDSSGVTRSSSACP